MDVQFFITYVSSGGGNVRIGSGNHLGLERGMVVVVVALQFLGNAMRVDYGHGQRTGRGDI